MSICFYCKRHFAADEDQQPTSPAAVAECERTNVYIAKIFKIVSDHESQSQIRENLASGKGTFENNLKSNAFLKLP